VGPLTMLQAMKIKEMVKNDKAEDELVNYIKYLIGEQ
jgi:hypothetical protein